MPKEKGMTDDDVFVAFSELATGVINSRDIHPEDKEIVRQLIRDRQDLELKKIQDRKKKLPNSKSFRYTQYMRRYGL